MASETFAEALDCVLRHEGGYADHPADPGGATMMGITRRTLEAWRGAPVSESELRSLAGAEAAAIYRSGYWRGIAGDDLPAGLDLAMFDFAVNSGPGRAIRTLQAVLGVTIDGRIGPETLGAARRGATPDDIRALCARRLAFLQALTTFAVFGRGWTRRVRDIERRALLLAARNRTASTGSTTETRTMDITKSILESRTIWANLVGFLALLLSIFGFDTSFIDRNALTENLFQVIAGLSFIASTVFRVIATRRIA